MKCLLMKCLFVQCEETNQWKYSGGRWDFVFFFCQDTWGAVCLRKKKMVLHWKLAFLRRIFVFFFFGGGGGDWGDSKWRVSDENHGVHFLCDFCLLLNFNLWRTFLYLSLSLSLSRWNFSVGQLDLVLEEAEEDVHVESCTPSDSSNDFKLRLSAPEGVVVALGEGEKFLWSQKVRDILKWWEEEDGKGKKQSWRPREKTCSMNFSIERFFFFEKKKGRLLWRIRTHVRGSQLTMLCHA